MYLHYFLCSLDSCQEVNQKGRKGKENSVTFVLFFVLFFKQSQWAMDRAMY